MVESRGEGPSQTKWSRNVYFSRTAIETVSGSLIAFVSHRPQPPGNCSCPGWQREASLRGFFSGTFQPSPEAKADPSGRNPIPVFFGASEGRPPQMKPPGVARKSAANRSGQEEKASRSISAAAAGPFGDPPPASGTPTGVASASARSTARRTPGPGFRWVIATNSSSRFPSKSTPFCFAGSAKTASPASVAALARIRPPRQHHPSLVFNPRPCPAGAHSLSLPSRRASPSARASTAAWIPYSERYLPAAAFAADEWLSGNFMRRSKSRNLA